MAKPVSPTLYTVPLGLSLVDILAAHLNAAEALTNTLILLPTNRAVKALSDAFVRTARPGLLLPRMAAVGDLALDETLGPVFAPIDADAGIAPAIDPIARELLLARLVAAQRRELSPIEALKLARSIATAIDQVEIEGVDFACIKETDRRADLSEHWGRAYGDFLAISQRYREELDRLGLLNPPARRNLLLGHFAERLKAGLVEGQVIAAGITTAAPAVAALLRAVAFHRQGMVMWPHVDFTIAPEDWEALGPNPREGSEIAQAEETHPHYQFKLLFEKMGVDRSEVEPFPGTALPKNAADGVFARAEATTDWANLSRGKRTLANIRTMTAADTQEEVTALAILMRQAVVVPGKTVNLITPDRELGMRVAAQLQRWGIKVDDSAGEPLAATPEAALLAALAQCVADRFAPVSLLALLKHPLVRQGDGRLDWLRQVRKLDLLLRGPRQGVGLAAIGRILKPELVPWWEELYPIVSPLDREILPGAAASLTLLCDAATALSDGAVWKGHAGRQLSQRLEDYRFADLAQFDRLESLAIPAFLAQLLNGDSVRPVYGSHPRIAIYGLLEARLQQADLVLCAGLNEGSWPQLPSPDPWLAPRVRAELKLPGMDRNIGLSAHDLLIAFGAKDVVVSRAQRDRSGPAVASRFFLRLQAFCAETLHVEHDALDWARSLDAAPRTERYECPAPKPSAQQRKVHLSITQLDTLKGDPYSFYARKILRLESLRSVDAKPDPSWRGIQIHALLHDWADQDNCAPDALVARAAARLSDPAMPAIQRALWQPRIAAQLQWVADTTKAQRVEGREHVIAEKGGEILLAGVRLKGVADRIDRLADGSLVILDYKSGTAPKAAKIAAGYSLQLGLLGALAEDGAIAGVRGKATDFEYWSLAKNDGNFGSIARPLGKALTNGVTAETFVEFARSEASGLIETYLLGDRPFTAKLQPDFVDYTEYDQLMRRAEWYGRLNAEADDAG
jgi:ATP-dependent helicase/nuclease subunit B